MYYSFSSPWCKPHPVPRITHSTHKASWLIGFKSQASLGKSPSPAHGVLPAPGRGPAFSSFSIGRKCSVSKICRYGRLVSPLCSEQVEPFPARDSHCRFELCQELLPGHFFSWAWSLHYSKGTGTPGNGTEQLGSSGKAHPATRQNLILSWMKAHYYNGVVFALSSTHPEPWWVSAPAACQGFSLHLSWASPGTEIGGSGRKRRQMGWDWGFRGPGIELQEGVNSVTLLTF